MKLPIGIQDFEKIRTGGYLYIDKTEHVYRLASEGLLSFIIGVNFSKETRTIDKWVIECN